MGNGIVLLGRDDRCGLGSLTEDFLTGMKPDRLVVIDVGSRKGKIVLKQPLETEVMTVSSNRLQSDGMLNKVLEDARYIISFETWYNPQLLITAHSMGVKTVLVPNWEWTPLDQATDTDYLICLSETDRLHYRHLPGCKRFDWPASPAVHVEGRPVDWPPKTFVHIAGNAVHNRDGTREVLQAAKHLEGTGAALKVFHNFPIPADWSKSNTPVPIPTKYVHHWVDCPEVVRFYGSAPTRREVFDDCDCLVQPRRLPGHSLPINEAWGEGIPVITLDLVDWQSNPYKVRALPQPRERFGPNLCDVWQADVEQLGQLMKAIAEGKDDRNYQLPPKLPSWSEFRDWWNKEII